MDEFQDISEYTPSSPPPAGHPDLAKWAWGLWEASYAEKERLGLMERWKSNYQLFRGNHWGSLKRKDQNRLAVNLYFANVQRTVANITAKNPVAEVIDMDGDNDKIDQALTVRIKKWWQESEQQQTLCRTALNNENYGITIEKAVWDRSKKKFQPVIMDAYSYFPAPGYYEHLEDMPYQAHAFAVPVSDIEAQFNVEGVTGDDVRNILGREEREKVRPNAILAESGVGIVEDQVKRDSFGISKNDEALVVEVWVKDYSKKTVTEIVIDETTGESITETSEIPIYPDGVRVITVCNKDKLLNDMGNPNINPNIQEELSKKSFAWGRMPFYKANSYEDTTSIWGFSAAEQTGDLNKKIDEILSKLVAYVNRVMFPPLVIEKGCGITKSMINNKPNLVLMPSRPNARIEFIQVPNLPSNFFNVIDMLVNFHDRVYQIEDADRGRAPTGVTAASAIVSLQERNAVLIRHKIRAIEYLCRMRGRWFISFLQNFSVKPETVKVNDRDEPFTFSGVDIAGRRFNYIIESDSTVARTSVQDQEQAIGLYKINGIDRQAMLEALNYPNTKQIIERMGETQLDHAMQILIDAGLAKDQAMQLRQYLMQPQTDQRGNSDTNNQPKPGKPKAEQGAMQ